MAALKWELNASTGSFIASLSNSVRIIRDGRGRGCLYSAEQWGDHSLRYPIRGPWCRTLQQALGTVPAPLREAHTMDPRESLRFAVSCVLDTLSPDIHLGADRLHGYLQATAAAGFAPDIRNNEVLQDTFDAFGVPPDCRKHGGDVAKHLLSEIRKTCRKRGVTFVTLDNSVLDAIEKAFP